MLDALGALPVRRQVARHCESVKQVGDVGKRRDLDLSCRSGADTAVKASRGRIVLRALSTSSAALHSWLPTLAPSEPEARVSRRRRRMRAHGPDAAGGDGGNGGDERIAPALTPPAQSSRLPSRESHERMHSRRCGRCHSMNTSALYRFLMKSATCANLPSRNARRSPVTSSVSSACAMHASHWSRSASPMGKGAWRMRRRGWPWRSI